MQYLFTEKQEYGRNNLNFEVINLISRLIGRERSKNSHREVNSARPHCSFYGFICYFVEHLYRSERTHITLFKHIPYFYSRLMLSMQKCMQIFEMRNCKVR